MCPNLARVSLIAILSSALLAGCDSTGALVVAGASIVSIVNTEKTLTDHAVSFITDEDCSLMHSANGEPYCQDPEEAARKEAQVAADRKAEALLTDPTYCYRTLGAISCYREPDPLASGYALVR